MHRAPLIANVPEFETDAEGAPLRYLFGRDEPSQSVHAVLVGDVVLNQVIDPASLIDLDDVLADAQIVRRAETHSLASSLQFVHDLLTDAVLDEDKDVPCLETVLATADAAGVGRPRFLHLADGTIRVNRHHRPIVDRSIPTFDLYSFIRAWRAA